MLQLFCKEKINILQLHLVDLNFPKSSSPQLASKFAELLKLELVFTYLEHFPTGRYRQLFNSIQVEGAESEK
jgi:hypothetical protein